MRERIYVMALTALTVGLFATSWIVADLIVAGVPPLHATGLRLAITAAALWAVLALTGTQARARPATLTGWAWLAGMAMTGFVVYFLMNFSALVFIGASELGIILALIPGFTYIMAVVVGMDQLQHWKILGVLFVMLGAAWFNAAAPAGGISDDVAWAGIALAALAALSYGVFGVISRRYMPGKPVIATMAWVTSLAAIAFVPVYALRPGPLVAITATEWALLGLLGALISAPIYLLYQILVQRGGPTYANSVGVVAPFAILSIEVGFGLRSGVAIPELAAMLLGTLGLVLVFVSSPVGARPRGEG